VLSIKSIKSGKKNVKFIYIDEYELIMRNKYILLIIVVFLLSIILLGCQQESKDNIEETDNGDINIDTDVIENEEELIVCELPYIRHSTDCCLDENSNKICDSDEVTEETEIDTEEVDIDSFLDSYNFPELQGIKNYLEVPEEKLIVFQITYGAPQDCPSGCFFSKATGIQYNNKIGWISVNDYDQAINVDDLEYYDFDSSDTYLYSIEFFDKLESTSDGWIYQNAFLPLMAKDSDTPQNVLVRIAEGLSSYIQPSLANALLENVNVRKNKQILTIIASLSAGAYKNSKSEAEQLLNDLQ